MTTKHKDNVGPKDFGIPAAEAEKAQHYAEFLVAAERERWQAAAAAALEWMAVAWDRIDGEWGPSGKTLDQECADGDQPEIAALRALLRHNVEAKRALPEKD